MAYTFKPFEKAVGSFVMIGISTILFILVFAYIHEEGKEKIYYYCYYETGTELKTGMSILYKGVPIGETAKMELLPEEGLKLPIKLTFFIYPEYTNRLKIDSVAKFDQSIMPGGSTITITSGNISNNILSPNTKIISSDEEIGKAILRSNNIMPPQRIDQLAVSIMDLTAPGSPVVSLITTIDAMLNDNSDQASSMTTSIASLLKKMDSKGGMSGSIESLLKKMDENGILSIMDKDKSFVNNLNLSLSNANELLINLQKSRLLGGEKD